MRATSPPIILRLRRYDLRTNPPLGGANRAASGGSTVLPEGSDRCSSAASWFHLARPSFRACAAPPPPLPPASFVPDGVASTKQLPPDGWRLALMKSPSAPSVFCSQLSMWPLIATATHFSFTTSAT